MLKKINFCDQIFKTFLLLFINIALVLNLIKIWLDEFIFLSVIWKKKLNPGKVTFLKLILFIFNQLNLIILNLYKFKIKNVSLILCLGLTRVIRNQNKLRMSKLSGTARRL